MYNSTRTGGLFSSSEKDIHINVLELAAVYFGLKSLCDNLSHIHIKLLIDNTTAVQTINNMGSCKSIECDTMVRYIWDWAITRNNWLTASLAYVISLQQCLLTVYALCSESPFEQEYGSNKQIGKLRAAAVKQSRKMFFLTRFWVILIFMNPTLAKFVFEADKHGLNFVNGSGKFNPAAELSLLPFIFSIQSLYICRP